MTNQSVMNNKQQLFNELYRTVAARSTDRFNEPVISKSFPIVKNNSAGRRQGLFHELMSVAAERSSSFQDPVISTTFPVDTSSRDRLFGELFKKVAQKSSQFKEPEVSSRFPVVNPSKKSVNKHQLFSELYKEVARRSCEEFKEPKVSFNFPVVNDRKLSPALVHELYQTVARKSCEPFNEPRISSNFPVVLDSATLLKEIHSTHLTKSCPETQEKLMHDAICDQCNKVIFGIRYKCLHCGDFDLCTSCEAESCHPAEHVFAKLYKPWSVMALNSNIKEETRLSALERSIEEMKNTLSSLNA